MKKLKSFITRNKGEAGAIGRVKPKIDVISVVRLNEYFAKNAIGIDLKQRQQSFLNDIIHEDAASDAADAIKWCIEACMKIEDEHGVDACGVGFHGLVTLPEHSVDDMVWILNHENKVVQRPIAKIQVIYSKDDKPELGYYFKNNGMLIKYKPLRELFKTKKELLDSL